MNKKISLVLAVIFIATPFFALRAETLAQRLQGRILLQVEQNGEAWFVSPENQKRYFLGRPSDAFQVMRELGLGISNKDFNRFEKSMPDKLLGKILIKVEDSGRAFYINPTDKKAHFLGRPSDAFNVMRTLGLGVTDLSIAEISEDSTSKERRMAQEKEQERKMLEEQNIKKDLEEKKVEAEDKKATTSEDTTATTTNEADEPTKDPSISTGSANCEFTAEYFKKENISGVANYTEKIYGINFNWGADSPELLGDYINKFAVRYTGDCYFEEGTYEFNSSYDDGIEATLDGFWLAKSWKNRNFPESDSTTLEISEGYHKVKVEYYDHLGDASLTLDWTKIK